MKPLGFPRSGESLSVLCIGAHSDDIEIGAGGTLLTWIAAGIHLHVLWCVLSACGPRAAEARDSANRFLEGAASTEIRLASFNDGFFPNESGSIKNWMESLKLEHQPDVILTHRDDDAHQDHREISRLTWNTYRNHLILEYEIPKWDGDLGRPNIYCPLPTAVMDQKVALLLSGFASQRAKDWFAPDVFRGLARLRGMECRAPEGYAEGFHLRKALLG